jgi:hypothetical protein
MAGVPVHAQQGAFGALPWAKAKFFSGINALKNDDLSYETACVYNCILWVQRFSATTYGVGSRVKTGSGFHWHAAMPGTSTCVSCGVVL